MVGEEISRAVRWAGTAGSGDARRSGEVALGANAVATRGIELGWINDFTLLVASPRRHEVDVRLAGSMTSLATDAAFEKWRILKPVLRCGDGPKAAGVALQTGWFHGSGQVDGVLRLISRRKVPFRGARVI
jgi:hypothetical protein